MTDKKLTDDNGIEFIANGYPKRLDGKECEKIMDAAIAEKMNDGWIEWHGGDCPVKGMPVGSVEARFRDLRDQVLMTEPYYSCAALWQHTEDYGVPGSNCANIIAYRIIADQEALPTEKPNLYISSLYDFDQWWYNEGGNPPLPGDDCEEHTKRMCRIAWDNGAFKEAEKHALKMAAVEKQRNELASCMEDHKRLVRELDVLINGKDGAARQASLCDLVAQVRAMQAGNHTKCSAHGGFAFQSDCGVCRDIAQTKAGAA